MDMTEEMKLLELMEEKKEIVLGEGCSVKFEDWKIVIESWGQKMIIDLRTYKVEIIKKR